jgi:predicted CopG family antitoxin
MEATTLRARYLMRKPQRITFTINHHTYQRLVERSLNEGRSLSNLVAHLVEKVIDSQPH